MIDVKNLEFSYRKAPCPTIKRISFSIKEGEIFGFLGPSGAGKSTTQKILTGLLQGYGGNAKVLGKELRQHRGDYYEQIGVGFELPNHYMKLSAMENLRFFGSLYKKKSTPPMQLLEMVGLQKDANTRVSQFSKGMKMRLCFARAIMHDPDIIFFDEPTSGLDPVSARTLKNIIKKESSAGKTIFLTTHNMHDADELCDRVAFIIDGEIKLIDSPRELKLQAGQSKVKVEYNGNEGLQSKLFNLEDIGHDDVFLQIIKKTQVETIHTLEATLEDVFITATGRNLS